jgi:YD repeat-containing protein
MKLNTVAVTTLLLGLGATASADINMMEASFRTTFIDLRTDGLSLTRTYDSRSTYSGLFGFGWCSNLDASVVKEKDTVVLIECGTKSRAKLITLQDSYLAKSADGILRRFSLDDGRLTGIELPGHTEVRISRARSHLLQGDATGEGNKRNRVLMELDDSSKVVRIESSSPSSTMSADFSYGLDGSLRSVRNAWSNTYTYDYDRLHNLTHITYPDRTSETLTYDPDRDRVTSFQGRNGCKENYQYTFQVPARSSKKSSLTEFHQTSVATLACQGSDPTEIRFDFHYRKRPDQRWALSKLRLTRGGKTETLNYKLGGL